MQKQGYSESTIRLNCTWLKMLILSGANLINPEGVKLAHKDAQLIIKRL